MPTADAVRPEMLDGRTALVVDVLRASTSIITALAHGATAVIPVADAGEARARAAALGGASHALVAGERRGETIQGFHLGNSPVAFASPRLEGCTVVFTTSNGTRALLASRGAASIAVAALVNLSAAAAWADAEDRDVTIVCAGERGRVSLEDTVCAGLLVARLRSERPAAATTSRADEAMATADRYDKNVGRLAHDAPWARHLARVGHAGDVAACLSIDTTTLVPVYLPAVDKVVSALR